VAPIADLIALCESLTHDSLPYEKALALTQPEPERQFLQERIRQLK